MAGDAAVPAEKPQAERTGLFTTGIVAEIREGKKIALFLSGQQHAGENLKDVLAPACGGPSPADPDVRCLVAEPAAQD